MSVVFFLPQILTKDNHLDDCENAWIAAEMFNATQSLSIFAIRMDWMLLY